MSNFWNIKQRLKNKTFCVTLAVTVISFVYTVLGMFDVVPSVSQDVATNLVVAASQVLAGLGILVDPTTNGIKDSERALTYGTENDVRVEEILPKE